MDAAIAAGFHVSAHGRRPVPVLSDGQKREVLRQQVRALVGVHIGDIGHIVPGTFEESHRVVFPPPEKVARSVQTHAVRVRRVRPIERHLACRRIPAVEPIQRFAAPIVVRRERGDARLKQERRLPLVVSHDEHDERLLAGRTPGEPGQIHSARPRAVFVLRENADRILPAALNQASGGIVSRHLLHDAVLLERPGHTPRAMAVVPPHAEDLDRVLRIAGTDEHLDGVAAIDARGGRVAFDFAFECGVRELPVGIGRLLVFDHDWIESRRMRNGRLERRDDEQQQHRHTAIITSRDARSVDDGSPGAGAAGARCQRSPRRRHRRDR